MSTVSIAAAISTAAVRPPSLGDLSPWGAIDAVEPLADGVVFVCTPSHGGAWLSPAARGRMPAALQPMHGRAFWADFSVPGEPDFTAFSREADTGMMHGWIGTRIFVGIEPDGRAHS